MMRFLLFVPAIVWLLVSGFLNADSEGVSKYWAMERHWYLIVVVATLSATSSILWLPSLLHKNQLSIMGTGWLLIATVTTLFLGLVVFREQLTVTQWIGIILAVLALSLLSI
jgi:multidrug transporter EmrE-like cation transporter